jgi:hypothetical protein
VALSGTKNGQLVLLLALLAALGGWNYYENSKVEDAQPRPYRSYSDANLEQLVAQYEDQLGLQSERYREVASHRVVVQDRGLLGEQVNEFERVQRLSRRRRAVANQVTDHQIALDQLSLEQQKRGADRPIYKMIVRRLFTLRSI